MWIKDNDIFNLNVDWDGDIENIEFKVNEYLKLRLEAEKTNVYINNKKVMFCRKLMLNISHEDLKDVNELSSIDEISDYYYNSSQSKESEKNFRVFITPEEEFRAHCSNLQAWYENNYDTRILHRNIAFPLLKKLTEAGDPLAKKVFKEEIAIRCESRNLKTIWFLRNEGFLNFFEGEELDVMIQIYEDLTFGEYMDDANVWAILGVFYHLRGVNERAIFCYYEALEIDKFNSQIWREVITVLLTNHEIDEAIECIKDTFLFDFNIFDNLLIHLCETISKSTVRDIKRVIPFLERNFMVILTHEKIVDRMTSFYVMIGEHIKGIKLCKKFLRDYPQNRYALNALGFAYCNQKDYINSIKTYKRALEIYPDNLIILYNLGNAYEKQGNYDEAIDIYNKLMEIDDEKDKATARLSMALYEKGESQEAVKILKEFLKHEPDNIRVNMKLSFIYFKEKSYKVAIEILEKVIKVDKNYIEAWYGLGCNYKKMKEYNKAVESLNHVFELCELGVNSKLINTSIWCKIGKFYYENGKYEKAEKAFQKTLEINQENDKAREYLEKIRLIKN